MRLSTALNQKLSTDAMLLVQSKLSKTQLQLASGKSILTPSDDVSATYSALTISKHIGNTTQYTDNLVQAKARLETEESTLTSAEGILSKLKDNAVRGQTGTLSASDRIAIGQDALGLMDTMFGIANTIGPTSEYMFGGYQSQTQPFGKVLAAAGPPAVYNFPWQGNAVPPAPTNEQRSVQVGPSRFVADSDSGYYVFGSSPTTAGPNQDVFTTIQKFANNMLNNTMTQSDINDLDLAMQRIREVHSTVGNRLASLDVQSEINGAFVTHLKGVLADVQDLDYTSAISRFNLQTQTLQAAQQSYAKVQDLTLFSYIR